MHGAIIIRVKEALTKAREEVKIQHLGLVEKICAIDSLSYARLRLEGRPFDPESLNTSILVQSNKKMSATVKVVFDENPPLQKLYLFGSIPWVFIQAVFKAAKVECPIVLRSFHDAYQKELQALS